MYAQRFPDGIWSVDFEFRPARGIEGNRPEPICMVVKNLFTGAVISQWADQLSEQSRPPFPIGPGALFVAYSAPAELSCFRALGWPDPVNILDLFIEFRCMTNGIPTIYGNGLLGALAYFDLPTMLSEHKELMRGLALRGGPWNAQERQQLLDYCKEDVLSLEKLLGRMAPWLRLEHALLRGRYATAVAAIEAVGVPLDTHELARLNRNWDGVKSELIRQVDARYGVYEGRTFKADRFANYLASRGIPWPMLPSGRLGLSDDTFKDMARSYPELRPLHELRRIQSQLKLNDLHVGDDGRNRCSLRMFAARTGRNQPSSSHFIFGMPAWLRALIKPTEGRAVAYIDWSQQEFGIAAALSGDPAMIEAYRSGDPYLEFAKQAGAAPPWANKASHKAVRDQFKACVLAVQYGMGAEGLAIRAGIPTEGARQLLALHRRTYPVFWSWSDGALAQAMLNGELWTVFGWHIRTNSLDPNARSLQNFPMQANGAEMLRIACVGLLRAGITVCAPVHDAILVEGPVKAIDDIVSTAQGIMRQASYAVLDGFELGSDAKVVRYPKRYMDERGVDMWETVQSLLPATC